ERTRRGRSVMECSLRSCSYRTYAESEPTAAYTTKAGVRSGDDRTPPGTCRRPPSAARRRRRAAHATGEVGGAAAVRGGAGVAGQGGPTHFAGITRIAGVGRYRSLGLRRKGELAGRVREPGRHAGVLVGLSASGETENGHSR